MSKRRAGAIASKHHRSFVQGGRSLAWALVFLYGPAALAVALLAVVRVTTPHVIALDGDLGQGLIAALTLLAGLLFALGATVLEKAIDMDLAGPAPGKPTSQAALRLESLSANALWTAMLSAASTGLLLLSSLLPDLTEVLNAMAAGGVVAVGTSGVAVSGRMFAETRERTERARTGVSREERET